MNEGPVCFGPFAFDPQTRELRRHGQIVDLPPQPARVLALLLSTPGRLVTREELRRHIWPDTIVEFDHGLNTSIRAIRVALGEQAGEPTYVQTVPRRGYRFIAAVNAPGDGDSSASFLARSEARPEDPAPPSAASLRAWLYYFARDYEGAVRQVEVTLALVPDFTPALHCLMLALEQRGQAERARDVALTLARRLEAPSEQIARMQTLKPPAALRAFWELYVQAVKADPDAGDAASYQLAYGYGMTGEADSAFGYLERAWRQRSPLLPALGVDPRFDPLRGDARFTLYLERLALPAGGASAGP